MERRNFLKGLLALCGAAAAGVAVSGSSAEAASLDAVKNVAAGAGAEPDAAATAEQDAQGQYYIVRRRYYYRPRRVYYRPRVYYYRRPVYYRRPRYRVYW